MNRRQSRGEKWDYASLEWIHRAREQIYQAENRRPLGELTPKLSRGGAAIARRLNLKTIHAAELPIRRRRTG